jgi:hypothetical protein
MVDGNSAIHTNEVCPHSLHQIRQGLINHILLPAVTGAGVITPTSIRMIDADPNDRDPSSASTADSPERF